MSHHFGMLHPYTLMYLLSSCYQQYIYNPLILAAAVQIDQGPTTPQDDVPQEFSPVPHRLALPGGLTLVHVHLYHGNVAQAPTVRLLQSGCEYTRTWPW